MTLSGSERFPRSARLRTSREYERVQRGGRKVHRKLLVFVFRRNELGTVRFGLSVGRKVGTAVVRNRVKRWLREAARRQRATLSARDVTGSPAAPPDRGEAMGRNGVAGVDIVLIARPEAAASSYEELSVELSEGIEIIRQSLAKEMA